MTVGQEIGLSSPLMMIQIKLGVDIRNISSLDYRDMEKRTQSKIGSNHWLYGASCNTTRQ